MIISQTPLRISLLGGGTDLPEWYVNHTGRVLGSTIDKYVYVIVSKRFDDRIVVGYSKQETVDNVDEIQHDLVRVTAKLTGMTKGFEVKTMADIPSGGSGLGSSSAILVGLLKAFYEYTNVHFSNKAIADIAFNLERYVLNRPVGKQDHYFASIGGPSYFVFQGNKVDHQIPLTLNEKGLYLFYTGITRRSSDILSEQVKHIDGKLYEELAGLPKEYFFPGYNIPYLIKKNWTIKKQLADNITNPEIELMCKKAEEGGVEAYKILGAGGGGFLLVSLPYNEYDISRVNKLKHSMEGYKELPFKFVNHGTRIIFNNE